MTYEDFMEATQPILDEAFEDGRKGIEYPSETLAAWETEYIKQHGQPMPASEKRLCAVVDRMMIDANREGLKHAGAPLNRV